MAARDAELSRLRDGEVRARARFRVRVRVRVSSLACATERWCASSTTKCSARSRATVASDTCTRPVAPISSMDIAPAMPLPHMSKWNLTVPAGGACGVLREGADFQCCGVTTAA